MQIHLTRNILLFANFILKQKISKKITLHVLALLEYDAFETQSCTFCFSEISVNPFPRRKRDNRFVNSHFL